MAPRRRTARGKSSKSYEVEKILDRKPDDMFLVKWKGFKIPTWEPLRNLDNCPLVLQDFEAEQMEKHWRATMRPRSSHQDNAAEANSSPSPVPSQSSKRDKGNPSSPPLICDSDSDDAMETNSAIKFSQHPCRDAIDRAPGYDSDDQSSTDADGARTMAMTFRNPLRLWEE